MKKVRKNKADGTTRNIRASHKRDFDLLARIQRLEKKLLRIDKSLRIYVDELFNLFMQKAKKQDERLDAVEKRKKYT